MLTKRRNIGKRSWIGKRGPGERAFDITDRMAE
jgi:hypothetical protein